MVAHQKVFDFCEESQDLYKWKCQTSTPTHVVWCFSNEGVSVMSSPHQFMRSLPKQLFFYFYSVGDYFRALSKYFSFNWFFVSMGFADWYFSVAATACNDFPQTPVLREISNPIEPCQPYHTFYIFLQRFCGRLDSRIIEQKSIYHSFFKIRAHFPKKKGPRSGARG